VAQAVALPIRFLFSLKLQVVQVTDAKNDYAFGHYYALRIITSLLMVITTGTVGFIFYPPATALIISLLGINYAIVSVREVFLGYMQKSERMDKMSTSIILQGILSLITFGFVFWASKSLWLSIIGLSISRLIVVFIYDSPVIRRLSGSIGADTVHWMSPMWSKNKLWSLVKLTAPIGLVAWLSQLFTSIPRLVLDKYSGTRDVGYFAAISSLLVAGTMITAAMGQAVSPRLAVYYVENRRAYKQLLTKLFGIYSLLGFLGVLVSIVIGKRLLTIMFTADYGQHNWVFVQLTIAGLVLFLFSLANTALTTARRFAIQLPLYAIAAIACGLSAFLLVPRYGMLGAAWSLLICYTVGFIGCMAAMVLPMRRGL
jgi:O-antigen/teichoic acid export membrane protein